jgi:uncharacterized protein YdcH (DUF465 family)
MSKKDIDNYLKVLENFNAINKRINEIESGRSKFVPLKDVSPQQLEIVALKDYISTIQTQTEELKKINNQFAKFDESKKL